MGGWREGGRCAALAKSFMERQVHGRASPSPARLAAGGGGLQRRGRVGGWAEEERAALCAAAAAGRGRRAPLSERGAPLLGRASSAGGCAAARGAGRARDLARPSRAGSAAGCPQHAAAGAARGQGGQHGGCQPQICAAPAGICCGRGCPGCMRAWAGLARGPASVSAGFEPPARGPLAFRGRQQALEPTETGWGRCSEYKRRKIEKKCQIAGYPGSIPGWDRQFSVSIIQW